MIKLMLMVREWVLNEHKRKMDDAMAIQWFALSSKLEASTVNRINDTVALEMKNWLIRPCFVDLGLIFVAFSL